MLYYVPLEPYKERYTMQWSAPKTGWLERNWIKHNIPYERIDGMDMDKIIHPYAGLGKGCVLNPITRTAWSFSQVLQLLMLCENGELHDDDIIYFDDFWHPGIEALPYTFHQFGVRPKMYAFCHAQSVDQFDFTYSMRQWMRHFEKGIGEVLTGVFVNSNILKDLLVGAEVMKEDKVHVIGHIFCEEEVRERFPKGSFEKKNKIVFSSRWDDEKNPLFFLEVVREFHKRWGEDAEFVICTSAPKIKSNNKQNIIALGAMLENYPNLKLKEGLTKEQYYQELLEAKIQISTSSQDFVSFVLLEGSTAGCFPVYPFYRSFPQALNYDFRYFYNHLNVESCVRKLEWVLMTENWDEESIKERAWIHERHNSSWARMLNIMFDSEVIQGVPNYD